MNATTTYRTLLARAAAALTGDADPDGLAARQALLLAAHAGIRRADGAGSADWDLYTVAITRAVQALQADLSDPVVLACGLPTPGPDGGELRREVTELVRRLSGRYAAAAAAGGGSPWRRLVWAQVADLLDDAAAELR